ncbi:MAG: hypothetical protein N2517_01865 [Ignavibacteria bacterium]|nr:hypothetical protein [Ignavibacteria bacterium]
MKTLSWNVMLFLICFSIILQFSSVFTQIKVSSYKADLNTKLDEFPLQIVNDGLLILHYNEKKKAKPYVYSTKQKKKVKYTLPKGLSTVELGFFSQFVDSIREQVHFVVAGKKRNSLNYRLHFLSTNLKGKTLSISELGFADTSFMSHPKFSPDGSFLVYSTDQMGSKGGTDIVFSKKIEIDGKIGWSEPIFAEGINSEANEITPFIDSYGNIFFSRYEDGNYNIFKAERKGDFIWGPPRRLLNDINTNYNEISPVVVNGKIYFSSDRPNGLGGFDIYEAEFCLPIFFEINFTESTSLFTSYDFLMIKENDSIFFESYLGSQSRYMLPINPRKEYEITIYNTCNKKLRYRNKIHTDCIDTSYLKYVINLNITNDISKEYQIPFFITGYYRPISWAVVEQIRKMHNFNLIGLDDSTRYIEYPGSIYDKFIQQVENSMQIIIENVKDYLALFELDCIPKNKLLLVKVIGYSDPRPLPPYSKYFEEDISDYNLNFYVKRGSFIDNFLLSKLRAYFTAKAILNELEKDFSFKNYLHRLKFEIVGGGIASDSTDDYLSLRKVQMTLQLVEE